MIRGDGGTRAPPGMRPMIPGIDGEDGEDAEPELWEQVDEEEVSPSFYLKSQQKNSYSFLSYSVGKKSP